MSAKGLRVLVVEDEAMIRILVTDMLGELGHTIAAEAGHIDQALELAKSAEFDLAILDVNLRGKLITPVAEMIRARGRPIIFATGYGADGLPE
jgi:CheY-like chemotaxis protein